LREVTYHELLNGLVENSLIYLYLNCAESSRYIPTPKRNQMLVSHLKPKIKDPQYRKLKNELKRLIAIGRKAKGDLELKLIQINKIHDVLDQDINGAQNIFDLLETLKKSLKIDCRFIQKNESRNPDFIYMYQSDIEKGFDDKGNQLIPLLMLTNPKKTPSIIEVIKNTSLFMVEETEIKGNIVLKSIQ
jgi:hypothetical protein